MEIKAMVGYAGGPRSAQWKSIGEPTRLIRSTKLALARGGLREAALPLDGHESSRLSKLPRCIHLSCL